MLTQAASGSPKPHPHMHPAPGTGGGRSGRERDYGPYAVPGSPVRC